jgi:hypothetical protein
MPKPTGHFYCDVCMMPFEDNAHLRTHLGTNKHINTLLKKKGVNIDEVDMDEVVDISKLSREELVEYIDSTDRFKELCGKDVVAHQMRRERLIEIDDLIGRELMYDLKNSSDKDGYEGNYEERAHLRFPYAKVSVYEIPLLLEEKDMLLAANNDFQLGPKGDQLRSIKTTARETVIKELRTEYIAFIKAKEKRMEKDRKEAEKDKRQAEKDEARRKKDELAMLILQAKLGMLKPQ